MCGVVGRLWLSGIKRCIAMTPPEALSAPQPPSGFASPRREGVRRMAWGFPGVTLFVCPPHGRFGPADTTTHVTVREILEVLFDEHRVGGHLSDYIVMIHGRNVQVNEQIGQYLVGSYPWAVILVRVPR